jgi:MFS family permease
MMNEPQTVKKPIGQVVREAFKELGETLVAFVKAPRALWGINLPYVLEGLVYFGILTILGKFCSENVGLTDPQAGFVYSAVTGGITFAMLLLGGVTDKIGVRNSLFLSLTMMMFGRILISLSDTLSLGNGLWSPMFILMSVGLLIMVTAYGLYQPAAYAGVKRYTNPQTAAVGYAVIYALMNLGAFIFGPISSFTRNAFESAFPPNGLGAVLWVLTGITLIAALVSRVIITKRVDQNAVDRVQQEAKAMKEKGQLKKEPEATEESVKQPAGLLEKIDNKKLIGYGMITAISAVMWILSMVGILPLPSLLLLIVTTVLIVLSTYEYLRHRPDHPFRDVRLVFFIFILIPVQTLFAHNWLTIPYYLDRAFTGTWVSHHFEILSNLNPIIIFVITPIIAGLTARANVYRMMILGTFIMAAPTFLLTLGPIAWVFVVYIVIMSVGEAMWQPRFLQWIAEIAPEGKTGAYMGIGQFPWFLTKVLTGLYSGYFVAEYVPLPETGEPMQTGKMWFIYALIAMVSPVALWLAKSWMVKGMKKGN